MPSKYRLGYLSHETTYLVIMYVKSVGNSYIPEKVNIKKKLTLGTTPSLLFILAAHFTCLRFEGHFSSLDGLFVTHMKSGLLVVKSKQQNALL
jgi:hypothetical protein